jgi:hypothetical protein
VPWSIQKRALRALEQDALALAALEVEEPPHRLGIGQEFWRQRGELGQNALAVDLFEVQPAAQRVVMRQQPVDLVREGIEVCQIHQADGAAADLVLIGRADAAAGGSDRGDRVRGFAQGIELAMQGQDQRDVFGDAQVFRADRDALAFQLCDFVEKSLRIEHHAVADHGELLRAQHAGGQQRELVSLTVDDEGVAGIVAALEAHDDVVEFVSASALLITSQR